MELPATSFAILLNGHHKTLEGLAEGDSLEQLIASLGLRSDRVAVEHNGTIARRSAWAGTPVRSGDKLEVVHFVGGG